jgi:hypothetical protein
MGALEARAKASETCRAASLSLNYYTASCYYSPS